MRILLTCFEPFGDDRKNSTQETVKEIPDCIDGAEIIKICLPVVFGDSLKLLEKAVRLYQPQAVLCLGQAGGRDALTPERIAININDARLPDNAGFQPVDEKIFADGPDAYFSTLPAKSMVNAIQNAGIPAKISNSAGTYVCNQVMYGLMYFIHHEFPSIHGGFMHIPYLEEQAADHPGDPGLSQDQLVLGVQAAIRAIISEYSV